MSVLLTAEPISPEVELAGFMAEASGAGAMVSFTGLVRDNGGAVDGLFLDCYPGMTERSLEAIAALGLARDGISAVRVAHRHGELRPGEVIVFVAAAAAHRREAFLAADEMMDRLKTDAIFWKRESGAAGTRWIEPLARDRADRARWSD